MEFTDVTVRREGAVGWLTINRPEHRNALRPETLQEICDGVDLLAADPAVRCIVLAGEGKHFAAGADFNFLEGMKSTPPAQIKNRIYTLFQGAAKRLYNCPKPTIAAVNGAAITVGCELALACDFRVASETALFQESWIRLGLIPPLGGLFLLPRYVGLDRAAQICLTGKAMDAQFALNSGLVTEVVAVADLPARAQAFGEELAALPPLGYAAVKEALHRGLASTMEAEWTSNATQQSVLLGTDDFAEGLAAVREKRAPNFSGT